MTGRLLIVGWDGADWEILDELLARGVLPHLSEMIHDGVRGTLMSTIPTHSWVAWPTFLTGMNPGGHGVFDFVERRRTRTGKGRPVLSTSIRAATFLERLSETGHEVRAGNVPVTFPPIPIRGRMISGGALPPGSQFVYPPDWDVVLRRRAPFPINGMEWIRFQSDPFGLVKEARSFVERRTASFEALLEGNWQVAVCVYVVTDRLQHPFGDHLLRSHPGYGLRADTELGEAIRGVYRLLDEQLPRLRDAAGAEATTVLVSDHGFEPVTKASELNAVLIKQGMAVPTLAGGAATSVRRYPLWQRVAQTRLGQILRRGIPKPSLLNWSKTVAYASVSGGGVSINLRGREPEGIVDRGQFDRVREEVRDSLLAFEDAEIGRPVADVLMAEELFSGTFAQLGPDLIALPNASWVFDHTDLAATRLDYPTGDHRREGVLVAAGGRASTGDIGRRNLADMAATALAFCDVPVAGLDGQPIMEISGHRVAQEGHRPAESRRDRASIPLSDEENQSIEDHLRSLGYIE